MYISKIKNQKSKTNQKQIKGVKTQTILLNRMKSAHKKTSFSNANYFFAAALEIGMLTIFS